ncbi:MAG: bacillithiol biosynthesis deacetylase BshB1 [Bacteroidota bacterium]|jgi:bacillithiol biosynthesis deacetylase BshB1
MKTDILAFAAHPDDVELACSGSLIMCRRMGKTTGIIDLTQGELGTRGSTETRKLEAEKASGIMQLSHRENLGLPDGFFTHSKENMLAIVEVIRRLKPEIILCNAPEDRHPDHARASKMVLEASFYAGLQKIETPGLDAWRPRAVHFYIQDMYLHPDFLVDISEAVEDKEKAIKAYDSQFYKPSDKGPQTPISSAQFMDMVLSRTSALGRYIGVAHAEGFIRTRYIGVKNIFDVL